MENVFFRGDRFLVDKTAYGIRLPITPISIPFTFDNFFGLKSYLDSWQLKYWRLFSRPVKQNDIVLFNNPLDVSKPLDRRELLLSRCIAVGGDTLSLFNDNFFVNGVEYIVSPDALYSYRIENDSLLILKDLLDSLNIDVHHSFSDSLWTYFTLSKYEHFIVSNFFSDSLFVNPNSSFHEVSSFIIPKSGMTIELNNDNINFYAQAILAEDDNIKLLGFNLFLNDSIVTSYTFKDNYYWFLSDNMVLSTDSRSIGIVSERYIIGKPISVWFNSELKH